MLRSVAYKVAADPAAVPKAEPEALGPTATPTTTTESVSLSNVYASVYDHVSVLVTKRTIQSLRSPRSLFCNMLFPIFLAIVGGLLTKAPIASIRQPSIYLDPTISLSHPLSSLSTRLRWQTRTVRHFRALLRRLLR